MRRITPLLFLLVTLAITACQPPKGEVTADSPAKPTNIFASDSILIRIADVQDRRETAKLLPFLDSENQHHRAAAAMAYGSMQDSLAVPRLIQLLDDAYPPVGYAAAYALGQTGHASAAEPLLEKLRTAPDPQFRTRLAEAIGKCGTPEHLAPLLDAHQGDAKRDNAIAQGLYRFGLRSIVSKESAALGIKMLSSPNTDARFWAAAYLGRARDMGEVADPAALLAGFAAQTHIDVRQHLVKAFGRTDDPACLAELRRLLNSRKTDYRVKVNAIRALGAQYQSEDIPLIQKLSIGENSHVAVTAVRYLKAHAKPLHSLNFTGLAAQQQHWRPRAMLLEAGLKVHNGKNGSTAELETLQAAVEKAFADAKDLYEKGELLFAMAEDPTKEDFLVAQMSGKEKLLSVYAMQALNFMYAETSTPKNAAARVKNLVAGIESGDVAIMALAAERIRATEPIRDAVKDPSFLEAALKKLILPAEIETYNAIEATLAAVRGEKEHVPTPAPWGNPIDWEFVKKIPKDQECVFTLNEGEIRLRLRVEDAPGSVANFVKLGLDGFYDNAVLHRVVPNFVAQGGDKRGDGWGSGPESIRSEWPDLHYQEGSVGLASSGKDTESCQWFISHCSTPHLDGRYTIFAEVISGMNLVHDLQIGDRIVKATFPGMEK